MSDTDKQALLDGTASIQTKIEILPLNVNEESIILTEENSIIEWKHEDFRYVKGEGFIGQFVARQVTGTLKNISDMFSITDREFILWIGIKVIENEEEVITWYSLGNFLVTKASDNEVGDKTTFEALDYTKKFNKIYENLITYPCTALELAQNVCTQCNVELETTDFINNDYIIEGNPFTNNETCRDVMKAIGKLAFSWVRVDWDNKVYIDFTKETEISEYDIINNSKYYNLKTQKEKFGPVNKIILGYSQIEGERTFIEDAESIAENGECTLTIYDNPLVYTQAQRESIIENARGLMGLEYLPLNMLTTGHPWLKGNELIQVVDMENNTHTTIPFDRTIQYFGHIKTLIDVSTASKTDTQFAYEPDIIKGFKNTEIRVDKIDGEIVAIVEEQDETNDRLAQTIMNVNSIQNLFQITGGNNLIRDSQLLLKDSGLWEYGEPSSYSLFPGSDIYPSSSLHPIEYYFNESDYIGGYDSTLIGKTVSIAKIGISNGKMKTTATNITGLILDAMYTLSFKITNDENTSSKMKLIGNGNVVYEETFDEPMEMVEKSVSFVAQTSNYQLEIQTTSTENGYVYVYDLMLNKGDIQTWEPASGELVSTVIKLSQLGVQVYSSSSEIATLMTSEGFDIRRYANGTLYEIVTSFNKEGFVSKKGILDQLELNGFDFKTVKYQGYNTLILYEKGSGR